MFIGHIGVAMAAKKAAPKTSLGVMIAATSLIDLIWPLFILLGWEKVAIEPGNTVVTPLSFEHYPITHSLLGAAGWSIAFALIFWAITKRRRDSLIVGLVAVSHWFLDLIVHRPDLPLLPGVSLKLGLGLWNSFIGTLIIEGAIFIIGVWIYARITKAKNKIGIYGFWGFVLFFVTVYIINLTGSPPPDSKAIGYVGLLMILFPLWAWRMDRNRMVVGKVYPNPMGGYN
jgi:membrane-bound metal-dependent hydrolase YbcI (DUF457 family)